MQESRFTPPFEPPQVMEKDLYVELIVILIVKLKLKVGPKGQIVLPRSLGTNLGLNLVVT